MQNTAEACIDLSAIRANLSVVRDLCPHSKVMALVKADAYGHGLVQVAKALATADGLAVARLSEALALRNAGIAQRILLLSTLLENGELEICAKQRIDVTAHDMRTARMIAEASLSKTICVWLKLDSGMHRFGLAAPEFIEADRLLSTRAPVDEIIHMTHFSSADSPSAQTLNDQLAHFWRCHTASSQSPVSIANSAALISRPDTRTDWVRPGIMLYGGNPVESEHPLPLKCAMCLRGYVTSVKSVPRGGSVGYNGRWTASRVSKIAIVGIGYGDGYPRHAANGTPVCVDGRIVPLVGAVSMDSLAIDVTEARSVRVGDEVVLWGAELPAATIANHANTILHHLFAALNQRVMRRYLN